MQGVSLDQFVAVIFVPHLASGFSQHRPAEVRAKNERRGQAASPALFGFESDHQVAGAATEIEHARLGAL